jgi:hypothetical protein
MTSVVPLTGFDGCSSVIIEDRPAAATGEATPCVQVALVTPGVFMALGVHVSGSTVEWRDLEHGAPLAVVSESFARRAWPGESALGKRLRLSAQNEAYRVIGVARDMRANGLDQPPVEAVYLPITPAAGPPQWGPMRDLAVIMRTQASDPLSLVPSVRRTVGELDAAVPIAHPQPMESVVAKSMARVSLIALLLGVASAVALVLSAVGIYGVVAYLVAQRRAEIGVRMALGARPWQVGSLVVSQSVRLAAGGVLLGVLGAIMATRLLRSLLFQVAPTDPWALGGAAMAILLVAALASWAPARRAMKVDPVRALRAE